MYENYVILNNWLSQQKTLTVTTCLKPHILISHEEHARFIPCTARRPLQPSVFLNGWFEITWFRMFWEIDTAHGKKTMLMARKPLQFRMFLKRKVQNSLYFHKKTIRTVADGKKTIAIPHVSERKVRNSLYFLKKTTCSWNLYAKAKREPYVSHWAKQTGREPVESGKPGEHGKHRKPGKLGNSEILENLENSERV